jgi:hypothetical protein
LLRNIGRSTFDGLNPEKIVFLMTLPNPDAAVAAKATVSGATKAVPISGEIGYCFEYPAGTSGNLSSNQAYSVISYQNHCL